MKTRGAVNGIWLTNNGLLHPAIADNYKSYISSAKQNGFEAALWTNLSELKSNEKVKIEKLGVIVKDYLLCSKSRFYPYFNYFYKLGMAGDKTAFALASDILRMAILELAAADQYYIYCDPNDTEFKCFDENIKSLDDNFKYNPFGFSFLVTPARNVQIVGSLPSGFENSIFTRNDVLIARKDMNPKFFEEYFTAYKNHLENEYKKYCKPVTSEEAQRLANQITNSTTSRFFLVIPGEKLEVVCAMFGRYSCNYSLINVFNFLQYQQNTKHGATWIPGAETLQKKIPTVVVKDNISDAMYLAEVTDWSLHAAALTKKYNMNFKAYVREHDYVDSLLEIQDEKRLASLKQEFAEKKIKTHCTFFKGKNHLVIPEVNVRKVSGRIYELTK